MAESQGYEILEHTADAGIIARGRTLAAAFAGAAEGMYALMVDPETVSEREEREVVVSASDRESLLVQWLLELLFLTETEGLLFRRFEVSVAGETSLKARACGERFNADRHPTGVAVKAVAHHLLSVAESDGGYRVQVLFDI